jgi:hypothetical protein
VLRLTSPKVLKTLPVAQRHQEMLMKYWIYHARWIIWDSQSVKWLGVCWKIRVRFPSVAVTLICYRSRLVYSTQNWDHSTIKYVFMLQMSRNFEFVPKLYSLPWHSGAECACSCLHRLYLQKGQFERVNLLETSLSYRNRCLYIGWGGRMSVSTAFRVRPHF